MTTCTSGLRLSVSTSGNVRPFATGIVANMTVSARSKRDVTAAENLALNSSILPISSMTYSDAPLRGLSTSSDALRRTAPLLSDLVYDVHKVLGIIIITVTGVQDRGARLPSRIKYCIRPN